MARSLARGHHTQRTSRAYPVDGCAAVVAVLGATARARRPRAYTPPGPERLTDPDRLSRSERTRGIRAPPGGFRPPSIPKDRGRTRPSNVQAAIARTATSPGHSRPRELLAWLVRGGAQGPARPLSEALLARKSARS